MDPGLVASLCSTSTRQTDQAVISPFGLLVGGCVGYRLANEDVEQQCIRVGRAARRPACWEKLAYCELALLIPGGPPFDNWQMIEHLHPSPSGSSFQFRIDWDVRGDEDVTQM